MALGANFESDRRQAGHFLDALHIISKLTDQGLELAWNLIGKLGQGAAACNVDKMATVHFADIDRSCLIFDNQIAIILPTLGDAHRASEIIGCSKWKNT
ncbi:hypothetical protein D3C81_1523210 [compost metagenome]